VWRAPRARSASGSACNHRGETSYRLALLDGAGEPEDDDDVPDEDDGDSDGVGVLVGVPEEDDGVLGAGDGTKCARTTTAGGCS
jgi:hypothetical protein